MKIHSLFFLIISLLLVGCYSPKYSLIGTDITECSGRKIEKRLYMDQKGNKMVVILTDFAVVGTTK